MKSGPHLKMLPLTTHVVYLGFQMKHFEVFRMYICCDCGSHLLKQQTVYKTRRTKDRSDTLGRPVMKLKGV